MRLGVVTTNLSLIPDGRTGDTSVLDFCRVCEKCHETCPPKAIPKGDRVEIDGAAVPLEPVESAPVAEKAPRFVVWRVTLDAPLPDIPPSPWRRHRPLDRDHA